MSQGSRHARVAEAMKQNLAEMIDREVGDPRLKAVGLVTVNEVVVSRDLRQARVYVSFFGGEKEAIAGALDALARASARLRGPLARRMHLKRAPELRFEHDIGPEFRDRISRIVREDEERQGGGGSD